MNAQAPKPNLVFLDDDQNFLDGLRRALNKYKNEWNIAFVSTADEAFAKFGDRRVDILISDHDMPGMMGDTVMEVVRQRWPGTVRVMLSGRPIPAIAPLLMGVAHRTFSKPCDPDQLSLYLSRVIVAIRLMKNPLVLELVGGLSSPPMPRSVIEAAREKHLKADFQIAAALFQLATSHLSGEGTSHAGDDSSIRLAIAELERSARTDTHIVGNPLIDMLWDEASEITATVQRMAKAANLDHAKQRELGIAGPYCNVGSIALAQVLPWNYASTVGTSDTPLRWEREKTAFGATGLNVGAFLLTIWGFPEDIIDEVRSQDVTLATMGNHPREVRVLAGARDRSWPELVEIEKSLAAEASAA
ncbi:response regulator [Thalassobaculum sp. OXR-137]|uniref:response regulator n=1 Tax=Thalassobaculum sp. OXR-137 TaxID=3100173 RepID=UPI002AC978AA|nr:response regulator [Thalassobaculum sp. OXR-137]WPZ35896.1 response regulator [Thalassobaculum sp. OXR-137]